MNNTYDQVVKANIVVHSKLAETYATSEPHFRAENIEKVSNRFKRAIGSGTAKRQLDLGCGTGFMISIGKRFVQEIVGVDVTQAMLDKVDSSGPAKVQLFNHDTGTFQPEAGAFDIVTAYSFLHHLFDVTPTFKTAFKALRKGGVFYADLEPNFHYWKSIDGLDRTVDHDPILSREIEQVTFKDEDIYNKYRIDQDTFNQAEYGKNIAGGFLEETLTEQLLEVGFNRVEFFYHWFLGQGAMTNDESKDRQTRLHDAETVDKLLQRLLPISRNLFKYFGFYAYRDQ